MPKEQNCSECGQIYQDRPCKCPHCGFKLRNFNDQGRLTDLIPGFRLLPLRVRRAVLVIVALCVIGYMVDLFVQLDELHRFMSRRGLPQWMRR